MAVSPESAIALLLASAIWLGGELVGGADSRVVAWGSNDDGRTSILHGATSHTTESANSIPVPQFSLNGSDAKTSTLRACLSGGSGKVYREDVQLADSTAESSWPDYANRLVELNDQDGSNGHAVPGLSGNSGQPPALTVQLTNQTVCVGSSIELAPEVTGSSPLTYQWFFNGVVIEGQTLGTLKRQAVQLSDAGLYTVRVANAFGGAVSEPAILGVVPTILVNPESGQINGNVIWGETNVVYRLEADVVIPYGGDLTIMPGVALDGQGKAIWVEGSFYARGARNSMIRFDNLHVRPGKPKGSGTSTQQYTIQHAFCGFYGGSVHAPTGNGVYGHVSLTDSVVTDVPYMHMWYPVADCYIERNVFRRFGGINVGHDNDIKVFIRNNVFYEPAPTYGRKFAVENWAAYDTSQTVVQFNSFMFTNSVAVELAPGYSLSKLTAVSNYWSTTDPKVIDSMISDRHDGTNFASVIPYLPFLTDHNSQNPLPPPTISVEPVSQAVVAGSAAEFSVTASGDPVWYQWRFNGTDISDAKSSVFTIASPRTSAFCCD